MSQHKAQFTHLLVTDLTFIFMWVQWDAIKMSTVKISTVIMSIDEGSTKDMKKKNVDLSQLIILGIMRILLAFSYFPTYGEI